MPSIHNSRWFTEPLAPFPVATNDTGEAVDSPAVGEHTQEVLRDLLGYDQERLAQVAEAGALPPPALSGRALLLLLLQSAEIIRRALCVGCR